MKQSILAIPVLAVLLCFHAAFAQNSTGSITGTVTDPSSALVGGAKLTVTNRDTGLARSVETNDRGQYVVSSLPVGTYSVRVEKSGFRSAIEANITLEILQVRTVDLRLEIGSVSDTVSVDSTAPLLDTETSQAGQVIKNGQVSSLPINVRQFLQLAYLAPMATPATNDFRSTEIDRGTSVPAGAGARPENNNYQIDGMDNKEDGRNSFAVSPPVDSISEFKVQTGNAPAEFGRGGGIIINVATKSGTNQLHGSLYEFLRNNALDARPFFSNSTSPLKRNQFGGSIGGPIRKDKLFFFGNYEGYRQAATGNPPVGQVFTGDQRNGIFSSTIKDPLSGGAPFANNTIPTTRISPISKYILGLVPLPNNPGSAARNFIFNAVPSGHAQRDNGVGRIDYNLGPKDMIYGRYLINDEASATPPVLPLPANSGGTTFTLKAQNLSVNWSHVFSPSMLNSLSLGYARYQNLNATLNSFTNNQITPAGITNTLADTNPLFWAAPSVSIPGYDMPSETTPSYRTDNNFQIQESVVWNKSAHTIKAGVDLRSVREYMFYTGGSGGTTFSNAYTGNNAADFLLGYASSVNKTARASDWNSKVPFFGAFIQDDWKLTSKLTLNLGLRYEMEGALRQSGNNWVDWDPAAGSMVLSSSIANRQFIQDFYTNIRPDIKVTFVDHLSPYDTNKLDFAPRVGLAYQLSKNWVIRSAYGLFYAAPEIQSLASSNDFAPNTLRPTWTASATTPNLGYNPEGNVSAEQALSNAPLTIFPFISRHFPYGQVHQWNFSLQHQLSRTVVVEAFYQGTAGEHLILFDNIDARPAGPGNVQQLLPYPGFARIQNFDTYGHSSYEAGAVKLEQRLSQGLSYLISYTRSKSLDDGSGFISNRAWVDPFNKNDGKGPSDFDAPNRFSAAFEYSLPFGKGHRILGGANSVVDRLVSGWGARGIMTWQNGLPESPSMSLSRIGTCSTACSARPDRVANGNPPSDQRTINEFYDVTAFTLLPAGGTAGRVGDSGRNVLIGPPISDLDFGFFKNTAIRERQSLEFRWEMFNALNHTQWSAPSVNLESPSTFGVITATAPPRIMQLVLRYAF